MKTCFEIGKNIEITGSYVCLSDFAVESLIIADEIISGSKYKNSLFKDVVFVNCDFQGTEISNCDFINCEFINCNFNFVKVTDCNLIASKIQNCYFCITNSLNCNFESCSYIQNIWEESKLSTTNFDDCFIDEAGIVPEFQESSYALAA